MFASPEARADRRTKELLEKGQTVDYETILAEINARDEQDRTRSVSPAIPTDDAVMLDNSGLDIDGTVGAIRDMLAERNLI